MMYFRGLVVFLAFLLGGARRTIRIGDAHHSARQQNNTLTNGRRVLTEAREALIPADLRIRILHRAGSEAGALARVFKRDGRRARHSQPDRPVRWLRSGPGRAKVALQDTPHSEEHQLPRREDRAAAQPASELPVRRSLAEERINSGKAAVASAVAGSVAALPVAVAAGALSGFTPQWELSHDVLAVQLALFGVVYRYAARMDDSEMLKQGVVGAFAVTRATAALQASASCTSLPLSCGAPLGYLSWAMLGQLVGVGAESLLAFGGAALALEYACERGWLSKLAGELPDK